MTIYADHTHLGRHVTGLERITIELFSPQSLPGLTLAPIRARGTTGMIAAQTLVLPMRMLDPRAVLLCPGFPPSPALLPFRARVIPYIHDLFLMSRPQDLSTRARVYMARPFALAVHHYPRFLVNSNETRKALSLHVRETATITLYRPMVRNVFGLIPDGRPPELLPRPLRLVSLGTVEPRKNYRHAAAILAALRGHGFPDATLEIIGRQGWSEDHAALIRQPGLSLSGYLPAAEVRDRLANADALLCTSHDEGLGLPLLEAQYAGLPIIAPDDAIFREVLGESGIFVSRTDPRGAAARIAGALIEPGARTKFQALDADNLRRWNSQAESDKSSVAQLVAEVARNPGRAPAANAIPDRRRDVPSA